MSAIEVKDLGFSYGDRRALAGVSFAVAEQQIFGLLGPNGGGKTTLFRILCTLLVPAHGAARVAGWDVVEKPLEVRRKIGVVFQSNSLDQQLKVAENLTHQGHLYGLRGSELKRRIDELLERVGLKERAGETVKTLSGGLRRRLELAKGLLHRPQILLLDEPTVGVDPGVRYDFWNYLEDLRQAEKMTILLTTHLMEEAERCDRLVILDEGRVVAEGTPNDLKERIGGDVIVVQTAEPESLKKQIEARFQCEAALFNGSLRLEHRRGHEFLTQLIETFPGQIQSITVGKPTLEDVFVQETGRHL